MINLAPEYTPSPTWWLSNISEAEYRRIYAGTDGIHVVDLFREPPTSDNDYFANYFPSKMFRLNSGLYFIEDKKGKKIPFEMNYAQHVVYAAALRHPRIIVLKSRQQGISTLWLLSFIDDGITMDSFAIGLMSQGKKESQTLLSRTTVALESLPPKVIELLGISVLKNNSEAISFSNGSIMYIQTSFRSGTLQRLHISEMGKISAKYPEKAKETKSGSLQAIAPGNTVVVESTAEGRKNEFYKMWHEAADYIGARTGMDFYPVFLSWVDDPDCISAVPQIINTEHEDYFSEVENDLDITLTKQQKWWVVSQMRELGELFNQEYPYSPEAAFAAVRDGTYYARLWREKGSVSEGGLYDPALDVHVSWDLGMNDTMELGFWQVHSVRGEPSVRLVDYYYNSGEGLEHYVNVLRARNYNYGWNILPHDVKVKELGTSKTRLGVLRELGIRRVKVLKRSTSVANDIEMVRKMIPYLTIDAVKCDRVIKMMYRYTKAWDSNLGVFKDKPLHDWASHGADAFRYYLLREVSFGQDGNFAEKLFVKRFNADLANDLGNLLNRTLPIVERYLEGYIPEPNDYEIIEKNLMALKEEVFKNVREYFDKFAFSQALEEIWRFVRATNKYMDEVAPWRLAKENNNNRFNTVIYTLLESIRLIALLVYPIIPEASTKMRHQIGLKGEWEDGDLVNKGKWGMLHPGIKVKSPKPIFPRIDTKEMLEKRKDKANQEEKREESELVDIDYFKKLDLRVADILDVEEIKGADRLYKLSIRVGDEERTLVAGIKKYYKPEELKNRKIIIVYNLKPAKLRGVMSYGMLLAAKDGEDLSLLTVEKNIKSGSKIS